jgi:Do/DeqQ family serine protease
MRLKSTLVFLLQAIGVGLAAALVVIVLLPRVSELQSDSASVSGVMVSDLDRTGRIQSSTFAPAVARAAPSVVNLYTTRLARENSHPLLKDPVFREYFGDQLEEQQSSPRIAHLGSGVIVGDTAHVLTNYHVIREAGEIRALLYDGRTAASTLVGVDPDTDLAVLRLDLTDAVGIRVADTRELRVGDVVLAIGNPYGWGQTVTMGIVSATGRRRLGLNTFENFIQTDAAINPGNSGGALINVRGELVGINTAIYTRSGGSEGIGFAIPAGLALDILDELVRQGTVQRGWLGIAASDVTPALLEELGLPSDGPGVLVAETVAGGPADRAGLRVGDLITALDGIPTPDAQTLLELIAERDQGREVTLQGWRGNAPLRIVATVGQRRSRAP